MPRILRSPRTRVPVKYRFTLLFLVGFVGFMFSFQSTVKAQTALSGTYTICSSGCDFSTIADALTSLKSNGVSGPVVFKLSGGSYNEQVSISGSITGMSKTNTVTFQGVGSSGTGTGVTQVYYSGGNPLYIYSSSYFIFKDILFENTGTSGYAAYLYYASYDRFYNCQFKAKTGGYYVFATYEYYATNNYFDNCRWYGGYYGFYRYQPSTPSYDTVKNSSIVQYYYYGLYQYYGGKNYCYNSRVDSGYYSYGYNFYSYQEKDGKYEKCTFAGSGGYTQLYFINNVEFAGCNFGAGKVYYNYMYYMTACNFHENQFYAAYYPAYVYYPNYGGTTNPLLFVNNTFASTSNYYSSLSCYDYSSNSSINVHFLHNTFYMAGSNFAFYLYNYYGSHGFDIRNNNFYVSGSSGYTFYMSYLGGNDMESGNNFYKTGTTNLLNISNVYYNTLADFQKDYLSKGYTLYDGTVNTSFVNAPTDLHYSSSSSLPWGKAIKTPVVVDKDMDGDSRCTIFATAGSDEGNPSFTTPVSSFTSPKKIVDGSPATFKNGAKITEPKAYRWYVNGKFVSDSIDLFTMALKAPSASVTLVTESCAGKDSLTKTFTVDSPKKAPVSDFIGDKNTILVGDVVRFTDLTLNYPSSWQWAVYPGAYTISGAKLPTFAYTAGDSSKPNVSMRFDAPGKYKICLTTSNIKGSGGTECKTDYIEVLGTYNMSSKLVIKDTKGYLYDDGGPRNAYRSYTNNSVLIDPGCAKTIYLIFNKFDTYCGYGYVRLWDGKDASSSSTELTPCTTNQQYGYGPGLTGGPTTGCYNTSITCIPKVTDTFVAKSGKMYMTMQANYNYQSQGFEAFFWSDPKAQKAPKASFKVPDSVCTNSAVDFINTSTGDDLEYMWDMDGDLSYFEDTKTNTSYPFIFPGQYPITLIAKNCTGVDTFVKTITVFDPPTPKVNFNADNTNPTTNDIVFLVPDIKQCVDDYKWTVTKKYGATNVTYVNGTSSSSVIPQVVLPDTGCYDVSLVASNVSGADSTKKNCHIYVKNPYCKPTVDNSVPDLGISEVKLNTLDNMSNQSGGYENYTPTASTKLEVGGSYQFTISRKTSANSAVRAVYIDWNADGDFSDTMEMAAVEKPGRSLSWTDTLMVPPFAKTSATVMRVAITQGSQTNDPCSNSFGEYEDYRIYIIQDQTPPVITLIGADTIRVEQGYPFTDPGATAYDNLGGNITARIILSKGGFDILTPGTYTFTYNVKDDAGNAAERKKRVVIVTPDKTAPDLQIDADDTIMVGVFTSFTEPTSSAWDLVDGDVSADVNVNDPVDINVVDTYTVSYKVMDANGNTANRNIVVIVADTSAPVLSMIGSSTIYHNVNTPYSDSGVNFTDNYYSGPNWDNTMKGRIQVQSNLDVTKLGTYAITYSLTDPSGNSATTLTRTIIIQYTMAPAVTLNGGTPVVLEVYDMLNDLGVTIKDNYYTSFTVDTSGTFYDAFPTGKAMKLGKYTIVYKITDGSGNVTTVTREIFVVDTQAPTISLLGSPTVNVCRWGNYVDSGYSVKDNYWSGSGIAVTEEGDFLKQKTLISGVFSMRYKAMDSSGNVAYSDWRTIYVRTPEEPDCVTGIVNGKELDRYFSIYPNPSSGVFTITSNLPAEKEVRITVTNMLGQEIAVKNNLTLGTGQYQLDISNQTAGVYLLQIHTSKQTITKRIVISK